MRLDEIKTLAKGNYISDPIQLASDCNITDLPKLLDFLKLVQTYNASIIKEKEQNIKNLIEAEQRSRDILPTPPSISEKNVAEEQSSVSEIRVNAKIQKLWRTIESSPIESIASLLPNINDPNFYSTINDLMIECQKDIVFTSDYLLEFGETMDDKESDEIKKQIQHKKDIFNVLKNCRVNITEDDEIIETKNHPLLIHLTNSANNSYLYQDLQELPSDLHKHFLKIFEPLITGESMVLNRLSCPREVVYAKNKIHQARIYMTHISSNIYAILGAMNKKTSWATTQRKFISNRYGIWIKERDDIVQKLSDQNYIEEQKELSDKVLQLLKRGQ